MKQDNFDKAEKIVKKLKTEEKVAESLIVAIAKIESSPTTLLPFKLSYASNSSNIEISIDYEAAVTALTEGLSRSNGRILTLKSKLEQI